MSEWVCEWVSLLVSEFVSEWVYMWVFKSVSNSAWLNELVIFVHFWLYKRFGAYHVVYECQKATRIYCLLCLQFLAGAGFGSGRQERTRSGSDHKKTTRIRIRPTFFRFLSQYFLYITEAGWRIRLNMNDPNPTLEKNWIRPSQNSRIRIWDTGFKYKVKFFR